jgi:mRNA interferase RelE/StbE
LATNVAFRDILLDFSRDVANSYIMKQISYTKAAIRALRRMPATTAMLIRSKIEAYAQDPGSQTNNVTALKGRVGVRLRVGDWRVIMDDQGNVLAILDIGPRGSIYN